MPKWLSILRLLLEVSIKLEELFARSGDGDHDGIVLHPVTHRVSDGHQHDVEVVLDLMVHLMAPLTVSQGDQHIGGL